MSATGLSVDGPRGAVRLKWHKLRRQRADTPFSTVRLSEGLKSGAAMEVDLRRHGEQGFVCLHDADLEGETNGCGPVHAATVAQLRCLSMRDERGADTDAAPLLLTDLVANLSGTGIHPDAMVQLDLKEPYDALDAPIAAAFERLIAPVAHRLTLSGDDWAAVLLLGGGVKGLTLGIDPSEFPQAVGATTGPDFDDLVGKVLEVAPAAGVVYLDYRLVLAAAGVGVNLAAAFQRHGRLVDAWTVDVDEPDALRALVALGVDQITTNECVALQRLMRTAPLARRTQPARPRATTSR